MNNEDYIRAMYKRYPDILLPKWAIGLSDGDYMQVGAQLRTRDGRRTGNAFVSKTYTLQCPQKSKGLLTVAETITDAGNVMTLIMEELEELFYPPLWIMDVEEARKRFIREEE